MDFYTELKVKAEQLINQHNLNEYPVQVKGRVLKTEEAIGEPERRDFPLLKGKEFLVEADFEGAKGQAFTDEPGDFAGKVGEIITLPLTSNRNRAVFISTLNAVTRYLRMVKGTIHCHDEEPEKCAEQILEHIKQKYGSPKIALVGFQPALLDHLQKVFEMRVLDLDLDNIGKMKYNVLIEHGQYAQKKVINWADLILATGSTIVNGTIGDFLNFNKPAIFYGTTIAGPAVLMGLERLCFCGT